VARWQAAEHGWATDQLHRRAVLSEPERALLVRLDGATTVAELSAALGPGVPEALRRLARAGLLVP
jgi:hypothetical protein